MATLSKQDDKAATGKQPKAGGDSGKGFNLAEYLKGVRAEWSKISWPAWPQVWGQTLVTITMVTLMTILIWFLDLIFRVTIDLVVPG